MPSELRQISIHVEEPEAGNFLWVLTERASHDEWKVCREADAEVRTYKQAMADGLLVLEGMVDDLAIGPRRPDSADLDWRPKPIKKEPSSARVGREDGGPLMFGFGPAT